MIDAREGAVRLRRRRPPVSGLLRRHRDHQRRPLQRSGERARCTRRSTSWSTSRPSSPPSRRWRWRRRSPSIAPGRLRKSFFTNSGTEANETAILAARCYTGSTRDHRAAPFLSRTLVAGHGADRLRIVAAGRRAAAGHRARAQRLLLPLPVRPDLSRPAK